MRNCCHEEACKRTAVILCEEHLQAYILETLSDVLLGERAARGSILDDEEEDD